MVILQSRDKKKIDMAQVDFHPDYKSNEDGKRYLEINKEGRGGVVQHAHPDNGCAHLIRNITSSQSLLLVDLSDTVNYPHQHTNYLHLENFALATDADNQADYIVKIGYLKDVTPTQGTFVSIFSLGGDKIAGKSQSFLANVYPNGPRLTDTHTVGNDVITDAAYGSNNTLYSSRGVNVSPGNGDCVVRCIVNAGTFGLVANTSYHSH